MYGLWVELYCAWEAGRREGTVFSCKLSWGEGGGGADVFVAAPPPPPGLSPVLIAIVNA
jgi:hypothetical protein